MPRHAVTAAITAAIVCLSAPAAASAGATQTFTPGAELLRQPVGAAWEVNFFVGATFSTDDGAPVSPVRRMKLSFPSGARFNADAFKTCSADKAATGECPAGSKLGTGSASALLGNNAIDAAITVFNGPGNANRRQIFFYARALSTVEFLLTGTIRKTVGTYGYVLDVVVPPIVEELVPGGGVPITSFDTTIGGVGRKNGKRAPLVSAPTACRGGWKFAATFTYANGRTGAANSLIPCRLTAAPTR